MIKRSGKYKHFPKFKINLIKILLFFITTKATHCDNSWFKYTKSELSAISFEILMKTFP